MKRVAVFAVLLIPGAAGAQFHRAEQDREITYWLLAPESHRFRISHDFNVARPGQKYVHSFVRKGSAVSDAIFFDLDTGKELKTYNVTGKEVNALGYYPEPAGEDTVVVQADLPKALAEGESVRIRVIETYTDPDRYGLREGELVWERTLGRPRNQVILPAGWMLTLVSVPAVISLDAEGRVVCRFINRRNDEIHVLIKAKRRPADGEQPQSDERGETKAFPPPLMRRWPEKLTGPTSPLPSRGRRLARLAQRARFPFFLRLPRPALVAGGG